jgi:lipopolysaccharide/colanic/teichoic acid biosynthesis glycosyltransferase
MLMGHMGAQDDVTRPTDLETREPGVSPHGIGVVDAIAKRALDVIVAAVGLALTGWLILACAAISAVVHGSSGFFVQKRVGRFGQPFGVFKLRTMRVGGDVDTNVTTVDDPRITRFGGWLRRTKIDELPQLLNVLVGHMSLVGPRPDVPGFADRLQGPDRIVLSVRPGITGPASLRYRDEEMLLAAQDDPDRYNREVVYPHKVALNRAYVERYTFWGDIVYLWRTVTGR